jgi:hypothetical protein
MFVFSMWFVFVRRPLSPSFEEQSLSNESKNSGGRLFVNWFFQLGKKKDCAPCHHVAGDRACLGGCHHSGEGIKRAVRGI